MDTVLFVCTGNTCRSPMAEAIARHILDRKMRGGQDKTVPASAGISAFSGSPATPEALAALAELGIEHQGRSAQLTGEMVRQARVVLCMTESHIAVARALVGDDPGQQKKILLLDPSGDVEDPLGLGREAYDALAKRFMELIPQRLKEVLTHEDRAGIGSPRS